MVQRKGWLRLAAAALALMGAYVVSWYFAPRQELHRAGKLLYEGVQEWLTLVEQRKSSDSLVIRTLDPDTLLRFVHEVRNMPFGILAYWGDSLVFWSQSTSIPTHTSVAQGPELVKLSNGFHISYAPGHHHTVDSAFWLRYVLPMRIQYAEQNKYLPDQWNAWFGISPRIILTDQEVAGMTMVPLPFGATVYLGISPEHVHPYSGGWVMVLVCSFLICLTVFVSYLFQALAQKDRYGWRWLLVAGYVGLVALYVNNRAWLPTELIECKFFDPSYYASPGVATSLGALLLMMAVWLWAASLFNYHFRINSLVWIKKIRPYWAHLIAFGIILLLIHIGIYLIKTWVYDSKIQFAFLNPLNPDWFSVAGLGAMGIFIMAFHLVASRIALSLQGFSLRLPDRLLSMLIVLMISLAMGQFFYAEPLPLGVLIWSGAYLLLLPTLSLSLRRRLDVLRLFAAILMLVATGAGLLFYYGEAKEKEHRLAYARLLIRDRDAVTEYRLSERKKEMERDQFLIESFGFPSLNTHAIIARINRKYFFEGFGRYKISHYAFAPQGAPLLNYPEGARPMTERGLLADLSPTGIPGIYFATEPAGAMRYAVHVQLSRHDSVLANLYVLLQANQYELQGAYPELLLPDQEKLDPVTPHYSFAIYYRGELMLSHGEYFYNFRLPVAGRWFSEVQTHTEKGYHHLWYNVGDQRVVVVSRKQDALQYYLSYFSALFVVVLTTALLLLTGRVIHFGIYHKGFGRWLNQSPLRSVIQGFLLLFVSMLILGTGYVTGRFILRGFNEMARAQLSNRLALLANDLHSLALQEDPDMFTSDYLLYTWEEPARRWAEQQRTDLNLYDASGTLFMSTQPSIFERGILSRKMNPEVFLRFVAEDRNHLVRHETIGTLPIISGYHAVRDGTGRLAAFVHLPHYDTLQMLNEQLGFLFVTLVNILVVALVIAGLFAPLISRKITAKLAVIAQQLQRVRVGSSNAYLEWPARDEIGILVHEYNKMIKELERSADRLAQAARESAWREMARQVAHEIKNPLTPMKLSVQHLKRAYETQAPHVDELVHKVCQTLVTQIDALSSIATEFSYFAKMPDPVYENVDVNQVIRTSMELLTHEGISFELYTHASPSIVRADRNQLMRVFNNIILNAIQAIPSDRAGRIILTTYNKNGFVVATCSDNGVGISEEEQKRVFVPNFTTKSSGTGLGLSISRAIVESCGGKISFQTRPGEGTTFIVQLPLWMEKDQPAATPV